MQWGPDPLVAELSLHLRATAATCAIIIALNVRLCHFIFRNMADHCRKHSTIFQNMWRMKKTNKKKNEK